MSEKTARKAFNIEERQKILSRSGGKCAHCGCGLKPKSMTVEHIYPIYKGGTHDDYNLVALCQKCNNNKSNFIYSIGSYYKYILDEYIDDYVEYQIRYKVYNHESKRLLDLDAYELFYIPDQCKMVIYQMIQRRASNKKIEEIYNKSKAKIILERAYEADTDGILKLIDYANKNGIENAGKIYSNEYIIRNAIQFDEVYVLRNHGETCGAFIIKRIKEQDRIELPQLVNIEENSCLKQKYIITFAHVNRFGHNVYEQAINLIVHSMLKRMAIPILLDMGNVFETTTDTLKMPYTFEGNDCELWIIPEYAIEKKMRENFEEELKDEVITEEEIDEYIKQILQPYEGLTEKEIYIKRYEVEEALYKKIGSRYKEKDSKK